MRILADTNVISELRKRDRAHSNVARWAASVPASDLGTSVLVLGEVRRGIEMKRRGDPKQGQALDRWFRDWRNRLGDRVLPIGELIAEEWAPERSDPMPLVDGLLPACEG